MKLKWMVKKGVHFLLCGLAALLVGCKEDEPPVVWNPADLGGANPVITSISPAGAAWSRITPILISGYGFSSNVTVYIGKNAVPAKSLSPTQITVIAPSDTGSTFAIKVINRDAYQFAMVSPYALYSAVKDAAKLIDSSVINALEVDANENIYVHQQGVVLKVPPGQGQVLVGSAPDVPLSSCMKLNKDGYLYMANRNKTRIYRMDLATGVETEYVWIQGFVEVFDFGHDGKTLYTGGRRNFSIVDANRTVTKTAYYATEDSIRSVRVYNDYVYVAIQKTGIWRNKINADGTLGQKEMYFDWQNAGPAKDATINDITFAENGDLYVATNYANPILIIHPGGATEFLYPGALDSPVLNFMWGVNSPSLFMNYTMPGGKRIGRVTIDGNLAPLNMKPIKGAPYYGRGG